MIFDKERGELMKKIRQQIALLVTASVLLSACSQSVPSKDEVNAALKSVLTGSFEIVNVTKRNEVNGLIEVVIKHDNQPLVVYFDKNLKYVFTGSVIEMAGKRNITLETQKKYVPAQPPPVNQPVPGKK